jgi:hypothetical protein
LEQGLNDEETLQYYTDQFINAIHTFVGIQSFLAMPHLEGDKALNEKRDSIFNCVNDNVASRLGPILWHFFETWIETNDQELWGKLTGKKCCLSKSFKNTFNNIFYYGFLDLTKHGEEILEEKDLKNENLS